jgi:glycine dehydrogenase
MDGANYNAILGNIIPTDIGFDICHFNLHKTFCIPHGGGGPGMGPIGVTKELIEYLPKFDPYNNVESISTNKYGSAVLLTIVNHYLSNMSMYDLKATSSYNIENTKYIISQLEDKYNILYKNKKRAHEFIIDTSEFKQYGIGEQDISKRMIDYGFHPPTMSWPVKNSLMIEITETEPTEEINRFIESMLKIHDEIINIPTILKNSPHTIEDILKWKNEYSIEQACFPLGNKQKENKFWPSRNRIDDIYGDKNMNK